MHAKRIIVLLAALVLSVPAVASARPRSTDPIRLAYQHAIGYMHEAPCGGHIKITIAAEPNALKAQAWTEFHSHAEALSWAEPFPTCRITFNREFWWDRTAIDNSWETFCVAMIHELGNLQGLPETDEPYETTNVRDAMLEDIVPPTQCTHYTLVYPNGHVERKAWTAH